MYILNLWLSSQNGLKCVYCRERNLHFTIFGRQIYQYFYLKYVIESDLIGIFLFKKFEHALFQDYGLCMHSTVNSVLCSILFWTLRGAKYIRCIRWRKNCNTFLKERKKFSNEMRDPKAQMVFSNISEGQNISLKSVKIMP